MGNNAKLFVTCDDGGWHEFDNDMEDLSQQQQNQSISLGRLKYDHFWYYQWSTLNFWRGFDDTVSWTLTPSDDVHEENAHWSTNA